MAPHSSTVARKIPWMEEPGGLQSMGSLRVRHDAKNQIPCLTHGRQETSPQISRRALIQPGDFQVPTDSLKRNESRAKRRQILKEHRYQ